MEDRFLQFASPLPVFRGPVSRNPILIIEKFFISYLKPLFTYFCFSQLMVAQTENLRGNLTIKVMGVAWHPGMG